MSAWKWLWSSNALFAASALWAFGALMASEKSFSAAEWLIIGGNVVLLIRIVIAPQIDRGQRQAVITIVILLLSVLSCAEWLWVQDRRVAPLTANQTNSVQPTQPNVVPASENHGRSTSASTAGIHFLRNSVMRNKQLHAVSFSPPKSPNTMTSEILEQWKKDAPRHWRKNPLGQSSIGLQQTFEAGICDQGVPDLAKEVPGPWQNWGLQGARFGCPSNQYATAGTLDFDPNAFSYASTQTIIPRNFTSDAMTVSLTWYSERTDGNVKWVVDRACVGTGQSIDAALIDAVNILSRPNANHSLNISSARVGLEGCKPNDELILRLARSGEDNADTLLATAHVEKMSVNMQP